MPDMVISNTVPDLRARLLQVPIRQPITPIERLTVESLKDKGEVPLSSLIGRVAAEIYREELRNGAWALDLGLFGSRIFTRDVDREVKAGNGILWEIRDKETA